MSNKQSAYEDPQLDFVPKFFILDKCNLTAMAVKRQDKYELSGVYVRCVKKEWEIWPASFNSQLPTEFPDRFEITMNQEEAWLFAVVMSIAKPLPDDWCLEKFPRAKDFPVY